MRDQSICGMFANSTLLTNYVPVMYFLQVDKYAKQAVNWCITSAGKSYKSDYSVGIVGLFKYVRKRFISNYIDY